MKLFLRFSISLPWRNIYARSVLFTWYRWACNTLTARMLATICIAATVTGCIMSNGQISQTPSNDANQLVVIGVPLLLGGFGSSVPVNDRYHITAKHVARLSWDLDVIHHPNCDLSLIRSSSRQVPRWGLIFPDQKVTHEGHSLLGSSIKGEGKYLQDVIDTNTDCLYSLSDAPVMSGMSGGPVFNEAGEIVGITVAIVHNPEDLSNLRPAERYSQFIPATLIFDWLKQLGIDTSYATPELASVKVSPYVSQLNQQQVCQAESQVAQAIPSQSSIRSYKTNDKNPTSEMGYNPSYW